jgi:transcriptional regulator with XRE-family HTH domain
MNTALEVQPVDLTFGQRIRARRGELGMTQRKLAEMIGVSGPYVHDVENGKRDLASPRFPQVAEALQVELATFATWAGACAHCCGTGRR